MISPCRHPLPHRWLWLGTAIITLLNLAVGVSSSDTIKQIEMRPYRAKYEGVASWYSSASACGAKTNRLPGCPTASGQSIYRLEANHVPFVAFNRAKIGSRVKITNLSNGREVEGIVLDRGGFGKYGRILDCSESVAKVLGFKEAGVARVMVEVL